MGIWGTRHLQALLGSLGRLVRNPLGTLFTLAVIALALALPLALGLAVTNARLATGDFANAVDLSVYFRADVPLAKAEQLARSARARHGVAEVTLVSAEQGLAQFREQSGFGEALKALEDNPLPHVLNVRPAAEAADPAGLEALRRHFAAWPEVELVQIDSEWVQRFSAMLELLRRVLAILAVALGTGVLAVVGNTVRLEILNRRDEIEVTKLVGGTNAFVRRPFLYTGAIYGLGGALLAWALVALAVALLAAPVGRLSALYGSRFVLAGPELREVGWLLLAGTGLGWLGAWLSAARHLSRIEPRA